MTSVLNSVSYWLGGARDASPEPVPVTLNADGQVVDQPPSEKTSMEQRTSPTEPEGTEEGEKEEQEKSSLEVDLQEVSEKAMQTAKEWGSYLYSFGKTATEQVVKTAKHLKDSVEEKTMLGEFSREQEKFVSEHREKKKLSEAAVPPWVGYNEEEIMKTQILSLSKEKRNFLRNPPAGVQFHFDYESSFPIAQVMLEEDPNLKAMRFELVPKQIQEEMFWRNYFYRVSLIKQSTQLTSLAQQTGTELTSNKKQQQQQTKDKHTDAPQPPGERVRVDSGSADQEFVSDTLQQHSGDIDDMEQLKKEMSQLGVTDTTHDNATDDLPEWEKELQAELQEYEVVDDGSNDLDDADLEQEIMKQIEAEVNQQKQ